MVLFSESFAIEQPTGVLSVPGDRPGDGQDARSLPSGMAPTRRCRASGCCFASGAAQRAGRADLRVNMYCNGMLVQSRLVTAVVGAGEPLNAAGVMRSSVLDFNLSPTLAPQPPERHRAAQAQPDAQQQRRRHARLPRLRAGWQRAVPEQRHPCRRAELTDLINQSRNVLQQVAWGYIGGGISRRPTATSQLSAAQNNWRADMIGLAVQGYRLYDSRISNLAGSSAGRGQAARPDAHAGDGPAGQQSLGQRCGADRACSTTTISTRRTAGLTICPTVRGEPEERARPDGRAVLPGRLPQPRRQLHGRLPERLLGLPPRHRHALAGAGRAGDGEDDRLCRRAADGYRVLPVSEPGQPPGQARRRWASRHSARTGATRRSTCSRSTNPQVVYFYCHGVHQADRQTSIPALMIGSQNAPGFFDTSNFRAQRASAGRRRGRW